MNKKLLKLTAVLSAGAMALSLLTAVPTGEKYGSVAETAYAVATQCTTYSGENISDQNYSRWSSPINSYLTVVDSNTLMRFQADADSSSYIVEYYDMSYNIKSTVKVTKELPIFGGVYFDTDYYYVVSGQTNTAESADTEVFRITKYTKDWQRVSSSGAYDCNTTVPFDAGSLRFAKAGNYLIARTGHEMYTSSDGYNHQSNFTLVLNTSDMTLSAEGYMAYASHSFNQFVLTDGSNMVFVDHGDAYPRSIAIDKASFSTSGGFSLGRISEKNILTFPGATGENVTGASIGGVEMSDSSYLIAYNSVVQDENNLTSKTRNIYVAAVDRSTLSSTVVAHTSFAEGEETTETPQLVKLSYNSFMLLWARGGSVFYKTVNGSGVASSDTYEIKNASLSDCVPIVVGGKVVWYTWNNATNVFYEISASTLSSSSTVITNGHVFETAYPTGDSNICTRECVNCGHSEQLTVATTMTLWWNTTAQYGEAYSSRITLNPSVDVNLNFWDNSTTSGLDSTQLVATSSDTSVAVPVITSDRMGYFDFLKAGEVNISIYPELNPGIEKSYTLFVGHSSAKHIDANSDGQCDECDHIMDGIGAKLEGYTVSLDGDIGVNYFFRLSDTAASDDTAYMQFTVGDKAPVKVNVSDADKVEMNGLEYYVFPVGVSLKDMTTEIKAQLITSTGTGTEYTYTVKEYADYILLSDSYNEETKNLVKKMLNLGAAAQQYFEHNLDSLANADLSESDKKLSENVALSEYSAKTNTLPEGISYYGTSLMLTSKTGIRHYFKLSDSVKISDFSFTDGSSTLTPVQKDNYYYVEIRNIDAANLATAYNVKINGSDLFQSGYSAMSYANAVLSSTKTTDSLKSLVTALYDYYSAV